MYLFLLGIPTPNGNLHLGHIAGPYLKVDVMSRALRRHSTPTIVVAGTDPYEIHVQLESEKTGLTTEEIVSKYTTGIKNEIDNLNIGYDLFFDPFDPLHRKSYVTFQSDFVDNLRKVGHAANIPEAFVMTADGKVAEAYQVSGRCPGCGEVAGSFLCEICGSHHRQDELIEVVLSGHKSSPNQTSIASEFFVVRERQRLINLAKKALIPSSFVEVFEDHVNRNEGKIRLSIPSKWGIPLGEGQVQFTYTAYFSYSLFCIELLKQKGLISENPFHTTSRHTIVASYGIDNVIAACNSLIGIADSLGYKPADYILTNYFYYLEESKFSTSRRHVINPTHMTMACKVNSDILRLYLTITAPTNRVTTFSVTSFIEYYNQYANTVTSKTLAFVERLQKNGGEIQSFDLEMLRTVLNRQLGCFQPSVADLAAGVYELDNWLHLDSNTTDPGLWLLGFSMIGYPLMPAMCQSVWQQLGFEGSPVFEVLRDLPARVQTPNAIIIQPISRETIQNSLPAWL
jgi:methionyl-tRNA synthetase